LRFTYVVKLARILSRLEFQESFKNFIESCSWDKCIENLHLHLDYVGIVKKITQAFCSVIKDAARSIDLYLLTRNFFIPFSLCALAILSRYNALACKFIQSISKIEKIFRNVQTNCSTVSSLKPLSKNFDESNSLVEDVGIEIYSLTDKQDVTPMENHSINQLLSINSIFSKKNIKEENVKKAKNCFSNTSCKKKGTKFHFRRKRLIKYRFKMMKKIVRVTKATLRKKNKTRSRIKKL
jgi:hypothetical protein